MRTADSTGKEIIINVTIRAFDLVHHIHQLKPNEVDQPQARHISMEPSRLTTPYL